MACFNRPTPVGRITSEALPSAVFFVDFYGEHLNGNSVL